MASVNLYVVVLVIGFDAGNIVVDSLAIGSDCTEIGQSYAAVVVDMMVSLVNVDYIVMEASVIGFDSGKAVD